MRLNLTIQHLSVRQLTKLLFFVLFLLVSEAQPSCAKNALVHRLTPDSSNLKTSQMSNTENAIVLSGCISKSGVKAEFGKLVADLLGCSLDLNSDYRKIVDAKKEKHPIHSVVSNITGVLGEVVSVNASAASKDGAKIVLNETKDWDDKDSLNLHQQKMIDELHPKIAAALLQVAQGRGNPVQDSSNQSIANRGMDRLISLAGPAAIDKIGDSMNRWQAETAIYRSSKLTSCDLITTRQNIELMTEAAAADDPTLIEIRTELQKFAHPNKLHDHISTTLQTLLDSSAYMMPTAAIAAAVVAVKGVVVVSTGGPEEDKLQHLLVLAERFNSRKSALNEEIQLAVSANAIAAQTNNKLLGRCADAIVDSLVTPSTLARITKLESESSNQNLDETKRNVYKTESGNEK